MDVRRAGEGDARGALQADLRQLVLEDVGRLVAEAPHALFALVHDRLEDVERVVGHEPVSGPVPLLPLVRNAGRHGARRAGAVGVDKGADPAVVIDDVGVAVHVVRSRTAPARHGARVGVAHQEDAPPVGQGDGVHAVAARDAAAVRDDDPGRHAVQPVDHQVRPVRLHGFSVLHEREVDRHRFGIGDVREEARRRLAAGRHDAARAIVRHLVGVEARILVGERPPQVDRIGIRRVLDLDERLLFAEDVGLASLAVVIARCEQGQKYSRGKHDSSISFHTAPIG